MKSPKTREILKESLAPADFLRGDICFSCEDCSYFNSAVLTCAHNLPTQPHLKENQNQLYRLEGKLVHCRFLEID